MMMIRVGSAGVRAGRARMVTTGGGRWLPALILLAAAACTPTGNHVPVSGADTGAEVVAGPCRFSPATSVHCGRTPTTAFDREGRLWAAYVVGGHVYVANSGNQGKSYSRPVRVNREPEEIYTNGENRPKIAFGRHGEIYVTWTKVREAPFAGDIRFAVSRNGGRGFEPVKVVNDDNLLTSHRFDALFVDPEGDVYVAWLDKRDLVAAERAGGSYTGAALYYAVSSDDGASFAPNRKVGDYSCECCRIAMSETPEGDVAVFWRHIFGDDLGIRDHGFAVLGDEGVVVPLQRATRDDWHLSGCPHHGPAMAPAGDGSYHLTWFTLGEARKGIFYGRYDPDGGGRLRNLAAMAAAGASHPYIAAAGDALYLVWKHFDGERTTVRLVVSRDQGASWSPGRVVADTVDASDHPLLVSRGGAVWLSWHTGREGLRIIPLDDNEVSAR